MDNIEVKLDEVEEKITSLITEKFSKNPPGVGGMDKEAAKDAKSFYTEQAKAAEALRKSAEEQRTFMEKIQHEASASFMRNVGIPGVHGAGGAEEDSGYKPKGFSGETGIMAQLKSAITKQLPESIQVGIAGGLAAGGIMALVSIIGQALSNSKILTTILGTIGQALGLLIDVILLPFLPILITGIIWLYQGIMIFYNFWNGIWSGKTIQTIGSALSTLGTILAKGIGGLLQLGINFLGAAGSMIWNFLQWLWGIATAARGIELSLLFNIAGAIWNFLQWLWNVTSGIRGAEFNLLMSIGGAAASFLQWLWNTITSGGANLVINLMSGASNAASSALSGAGSWLSGLESGIGNLLHFDQGGVVPGSGPQLAVVHGGETVTQAGQSTGNITINANNYVGSKTELMKVVTDALRQNQYRYNV